jgi:hypothetical protein
LIMIMGMIHLLPLQGINKELKKVVHCTCGFIYFHIFILIFAIHPIPHKVYNPSIKLCLLFFILHTNFHMITRSPLTIHLINPINFIIS